jgi:hypothetical protein
MTVHMRLLRSEDDCGIDRNEEMVGFLRPGNEPGP